MSYYFCMWSLEWTKDSELSKYESLFADLWWSVVKSGSFYVISDARPRMINSFENRRVSQIWIDWFQQSLPLKCKIRLDRLRVDGLNLVEIDGKKKQFKIVQKYIPNNLDTYNKLASQSFHVGGWQFIKPQILVERMGYRLDIWNWYDPVFISCDQLERLVEGKLLLQIGYLELSNTDGNYNLFVNPIKKIQQERYSVFFNGKPIDDLRDQISIPTTSDFFRFNERGGYFRITDSKSIHFDRNGNIAPNQEFDIDFLDVLSLRVFAWFYPFFRRFTGLTTGTYRLIVDSTRKIIELKKM